MHGMLWVLQETFSESLLAREGPSAAFFENSWNLASCSCGLTSGNTIEHERGVRRDAQSSSVPTPRFNQGLGTLNPLYHTEGTYSQNGVMDTPRFQISGMHLGKFLYSLEFQHWNVNFKTEVCANSVLRQITMHWIKEVEIAKSIDDPLTSQSITGRRDFPDCEMLDAMIESASKKIITSVHVRRRASVEEQCAQKDDRFLRERQIAHMIYDQDFDTRWNQAHLAASVIPTEAVLEGLYKSNLQDSVQLQTVLALYEQENIRNNEQPSLSRLKTSVRCDIDQTMRTRNFRAERISGDTSSNQEAKRETSQRG